MRFLPLPIPAPAVAAVTAVLALPAAACPDANRPVQAERIAGGQTRSFSLQAGGPHDLQACPQPGLGWTAAQPDLALDLSAGAARDLTFRVQAACDTVLLVNDSRGQWHFNDDSQGLNPGLTVPAAGDGTYRLWVGTFGRGAGCPAQLTVTVGAPGPSQTQGCPDWRLTGQSADLAGPGAARAIALRAGGATHLGQCQIQGTGFVTPAPQVDLTVRGLAGQALDLSVQATCDTVLLVNDARGQWHFNDDSQGLNPALTLPGAADGVYDIWVGTFGTAACDATLFARAGGAAPPPPACPDPGRAGPVQPQTFASLRAPLGVPLRAGGAARIADCGGLPGTGYADAAPQLSLDLSQVPAGGSLDISATADCDTVLLVRDPLGEWNFSDDRDGLNPGLTLAPATAGRYGIWLGTYGPTACEATLMLSALGGETGKDPARPRPAGRVQPQTLDFGAGIDGWRGEHTTLSRILGGPGGGFVMNALSAGDGRVGYAVAPPALRGDWRGIGGVQVVMRSAPGRYVGAFAEGAVGDIVLRNGAMTAAAAFPEWVGQDWGRRSVPFRQAVLQDGQRRWRLSGGAQSLDDVLANVTDFRIRVEFMAGDTTAGLAEVALLPAIDGPPVGADPAVLPDPGNLSGFRDRVGQTLRFTVTGAAGGAVWGDDVYTDDSSLARAAVHAGALREGETGVIEVTILPGQSSYPASTRNGVQTGSWGAWSGSYRIAGRGADAGGAPVQTAYAQPRVRGARVDWCVTWATDCGQPGADNFCRQMGHERATAWQVEGGQQTLVLGSGQICGPGCDALRDVVCVGGSAQPPARRLIRPPGSLR